MIYANYKMQARPNTRHLTRGNYYGADAIVVKPHALSYVVEDARGNIVFESKSRGQCNQYAMQRLDEELSIKAVRG